MTLSVRSIDPSDRERLLAWRNDPRVRAVSANDAPIEADEHDRWFELTLSERSDWLVLATWGDESVGVVQLTDVDVDDRTASWGCHLGVTEVPPGVGASLPLIGLALGFGRFGARRMVAEVLGHNRNMLSMHRRLAIPREGVRREAVRRSEGEFVDVVEFGVLHDEWPGILDASERLLPTQVRSGLAEVVAILGA